MLACLNVGMSAPGAIAERHYAGNNNIAGVNSVVKCAALITPCDLD